MKNKNNSFTRTLVSILLTYIFSLFIPETLTNYHYLVIALLIYTILDLFSLRYFLANEILNSEERQNRRNDINNLK